MARIVITGPPDAAVALTGAAVAGRLRARYVDGGELRPRARRRPRRRDDVASRSDIEVWFDALRAALLGAPSVVVTSGVLTRPARDVLRRHVDDLVFVELVTGHSPADPLMQDEAGFRVADDADLPSVVERIVELLAGR